MSETADKLELSKTDSVDSFVVLDEEKNEQSAKVSDNREEVVVTKNEDTSSNETLILETPNDPLELDDKNQEVVEEANENKRKSMFAIVLEEIQKEKNVSSDWRPETRTGYQELYKKVCDRLQENLSKNIVGACELDSYKLFEKLSSYPSLRLERPSDLIERKDGFTTFMSDKDYQLQKSAYWGCVGFDMLQKLQHRFMVCGVPYLDWSRLSLYFLQESSLHTLMNSPKYNYNIPWCDLLLLYAEMGLK